MIVCKAESFDDLVYNKLGKMILLDTDGYYNTCGENAYFRDLIINTSTVDCSLDLGDFLYTKSKWSQLLKLYVDKESLVEFANNLKKSPSYSQTYYFKQKPRTVGNGNGSCLISLVVSRPKRGSPFDKVTVMYRATVLSKQFICDLILVNKIVEYINSQLMDKAEIDKATFYIPWASINAFHLALYHKLFKVNIYDYPKNYLCSKAIKWRREVFSGKRVTKYKSFDRLIRYSNQGGLDSIPIDSINIFD